MTNTKKVLIVGAGSMGLAVGYHLATSGTDVTFLARPHHAARLAVPQVLYSYDDDSLRPFSEYRLIIDPEMIATQAYDFIVITLDGAALKDPAGVAVVTEIGRAVRDRGSRVVISAVGVGLKDWFVQTATISADQVTYAVLGIQCYSPKAVTLPLHAPTDAARLAEADLAYRHCWPFGFVVDDSAPSVAQVFADLYNRNRESRCVIQPAADFMVGILAFFPFMAIFEPLGWPDATAIDPENVEWILATEASKEIQGLSIHGNIGGQAAKEASPERVAETWRVWEQDMLPLDLQAFNKYHHGGKVNRQDRQLLAECVMLGEAEGLPMASLKSLLAKVET